MGISGRTSTAAATTAGTAPVPGKVYLRRPVGATAVPASAPPDAVPVPTAPAPDGGARGARGRVDAPAGVRAAGNGAVRAPGASARTTVTTEIARLLTWWLEAYDGRRPVAALRRGPYAPLVTEELRAQIRDAPDRRYGTPSRLLRVHLPPSHRQRLSFTASVSVDGRVRAVVGHLARHGSRWRVESVVLV